MDNSNPFFDPSPPGFLFSSDGDFNNRDIDTTPSNLVLHGFSWAHDEPVSSDVPLQDGPFGRFLPHGDEVGPSFHPRIPDPAEEVPSFDHPPLFAADPEDFRHSPVFHPLSNGPLRDGERPHPQPSFFEADEGFLLRDPSFHQLPPPYPRYDRPRRSKHTSRWGSRDPFHPQAVDSAPSSRKDRESDVVRVVRRHQHKHHQDHTSSEPSQPENCGTDSNTAIKSSPPSDEKRKDYMNSFASGIVKAAASSKLMSGTAIDKALQEVCRRVLNEKTKSSGEEDSNSPFESSSLKRPLNSASECDEAQVCSLEPPAKLMKHKLEHNVSDAVDFSMSLSEEQKRILEKKGITGEWLARFRVIYNTMMRLHARGSDSNDMFDALSTQAQELSLAQENDDQFRGKRRRSSDRKLDPSVCSPKKKRRED